MGNDHKPAHLKTLEEIEELTNGVCTCRESAHGMVLTCLPCNLVLLANRAVSEALLCTQDLAESLGAMLSCLDRYGGIITPSTRIRATAALSAYKHSRATKRESN